MSEAHPVKEETSEGIEDLEEHIGELTEFRSGQAFHTPAGSEP